MGLILKGVGVHSTIIGGAGAKVVAVARASLVAGKEDRISALPSPQGLPLSPYQLLGLGLCLIPPELLM